MLPFPLGETTQSAGFMQAPSHYATRRERSIGSRKISGAMQELASIQKRAGTNLKR